MYFDPLDPVGSIGVEAIETLRFFSARPDTPSSVLADWKTMESWLGCAGRELNNNDRAKISDAYRSYVIKGRSPSSELEFSTINLSQIVKNEIRGLIDIPPQIESVFDRLFATDEQIEAKRQLEKTRRESKVGLSRATSEGNIGKVVLYKNNEYMCYCQIKLGSGERIQISIAAAPTPSVKIFKMGLLGIFPVKTIWEYNPTMAGGYEAYIRKVMMMFQDPLATEQKHPLDILRDFLIGCESISEVRDLLFSAERSITSRSHVG